MDRTATQIITRALRATKVVGLDQSPTAFTLSEGLLVLQSMLDGMWADTSLHYPDNYAMPWFADLTTTVTVGNGVTEILEYELAKRIAPENGAVIDPSLAAAGAHALRRRRATIANLRVAPMTLESAYLNNEGGDYDIVTDT